MESDLSDWNVIGGDITANKYLRRHYSEARARDTRSHMISLSAGTLGKVGVVSESVKYSGKRKGDAFSLM